jgi:membrane-associated phospholipid phosphatase
MKGARTASAALLLLGPLFLGPPAPARAQAPATRPAPPSRGTEYFLSNGGNLLYLSLGAGLPLLEDKGAGRGHTLRTLDAVATSAALAEGLKYLTREKRPDTGDRNSFPSGHAAAAFAVASMESAFHPGQAPEWYLGAALIADSRVRLHRHYAHDVLAGAALGYLTARWERSRPRGLMLSPFAGPGGRALGLQLDRSF